MDKYNIISTKGQLILNKYFYKSFSLYGDKIINNMSSFFNTTPIHPNKIYENSLHIVWGLLRGSDFILKECIKNKQNFLYIDHAYFNPGHKKPNPNYRILLNKFNAGEFISRPDDRLPQLEIKPWNKNGNHILVCPPTETSKYFFNCHDWLDKTLEELKKYTDRKIIIRTKPNEARINIINGILYPVHLREKHPETPLQEHLTNCHAVITYNSNISIDAILNGIPVFVPNINSAYPVGCPDLSKIENPSYPDNRYEWCKHLSYCQFNMEEIKSGIIWKILEI